jgi:hypothetical protein
LPASATLSTASFDFDKNRRSAQDAPRNDSPTR